MEKNVKYNIFKKNQSILKGNVNNYYHQVSSWMKNIRISRVLAAS